MLKVLVLLLVAVLASCKLNSGCPEGCVCLGLEPGLPCAACRKGFYLQSGTCVPNCAPGFVLNGTKTCEPCPTSCLKCTTEGRCLQCRKPALLTVSGKCVTFNTHRSRETHLPSSEVVDTAFTIPKEGPFLFSLRDILGRLNDKSRVNLVISPKFGTLLIKEASRSKLLQEGDYLDMRVLLDSELSYTSRVFPQSGKDFAAFVVTHQNHNTLIKLEFNIGKADDSGNYVKDSSPALRITEGETVSIPRNYFRLEAFGFPESHLFLRLKTSLKYGSLLAEGKIITAGHFFNHEVLSQDKLAYHCDGETGTDPVQELIQLDITARVPRESKGSNGRINLNPITSSESRIPRSITDDYQLLSTQTIAVDIKPRDNQSPLAVVHNELAVDEGGTEIISPDIITVTDPDTRADYLRIVIETPPKFGYLEVRSNAPTTGKRLSAKSSFPLEDLLQERLSYVQSEHRNLEPSEDSFTFHVSDGNNKSPPLEVEIKIENVNDEPPQVTSLPLIVKPGAVTDVTSDVFKVYDLDTFDSEITVALSRAPLHGNLKKYESEWGTAEILKESDTFSYDDLLQGYILYEADPTDAVEDEIHFTVSDGDGEFQQEAILRVQIQQDPTPEPVVSTTTEGTPLTTSTTPPSSSDKDDQKPSCRMEFSSSDVTGSESGGILKIPVKRSGDLSGTCSVVCVTETKSARNGSDFESRDCVEQSRIFFLKGVTLITCDVNVLDDDYHEGTEDFIVKLVHPEGEGQVRGVLGDQSELVALINDDEDRTLIQFEQILYKSAAQDAAAVSVLLKRTGDLRFLSKVRVYTKDVSARSGIDFEPVDNFVDFLPGENVAVVDVPLKKSTTKRYWTSRFQVFLSTKQEDRVSADIGPTSYTTVTIVPEALNGPAVLPAEPYVVSLLHYDKASEVQEKEINPGYPVVCVTPCDPKYPRYAETVAFCRNASLDVSKIAFSWEISPFTDETFGSVFHQLSDSTLFGSVLDRVLDSSFFSAGSRLRCVARPSVNGTLGLAIRSKPVLITNHHHCTPPVRFSSSPIGQQPFRAVMSYIPANAAEEKHKDRFRINVEIPHFDGMIPLISTYPLHGVRYLLTEPVYRSQHECSNLKAGFAFLEADASNATSMYPYQYSDSLRTESSIRLYRHLDLQSCLWNFQAHFSMTDLVDLCGGQITSDYKISSRGRTHVTVRVPLYVAFVTHDHGWSSVEHRTELEFSFLYTPVLVHRGMKTQALTATKPQLTRLTTDINGRLIVEFKTESQFRGRYLAEDPESGVKSELIPPDNLGTDFQLDLVWTREKAGGSEQIWRAVSTYTLHDYSGNYKLRLVPCLAADESSAKEKCKADKPTQADLVISYQLPYKPEPVIYDLDTLFHLTNDRESFLRVPRSIEELKEVDNEGVFSRGQKVYGRVLWYPGHNLSSYQLQIEKLYLCSGQDGHVPAYDPTGEIHQGIPQYGCMDSSSRLKHRILLLNREEPYFMDKNVNGISLEAKFANEIDEMRALAKMTGIDGFVFDVDPLYRLEAGVQWFLQVIYSIKPLSSRARRSSDDGYPRSGTSMRTLILRQDASELAYLSRGQSFTLCLSLLGLLLAVILLVSIVYYRRLRHNRTSHRSSSMLMAAAVKETEPSAPSENCTLV